MNISLRLILSVFLISILSLYGAWTLSRSKTYQVFGSIVPRVETEQKLVALTFDDGPMPGKTEAVLEALAESGAVATFFLVGEAIQAHPQLAELIANAGHEIGNHSYTHSRMVLTPPSVVAQELEQTNTLIRASGYTGDIHFRPPYGKKLLSLPYYLDENHITTITWDVAPEVALGRSASAEQISTYVAENATPGSIILLHIMFDSRKNSLAAVPKVIEKLQRQGYRFMTVSELLSHRAN